MKEIIQKSLKEFIADRYLLILVSLSIIVALTFAITVGISIHPSERQLISHYSAFGITHFYFDQWFYLLVFVFFGLNAAIMHAVISVKLLIVKGHSLAIMYAWLGLVIVLFGWIMASKILDLRALL